MSIDRFFPEPFDVAVPHHLRQWRFVNQLSGHFLVVTTKWGSSYKKFFSLGEVAKCLLPSVSRRVMPFIDDDQVEEVGRDSPGQARSAVAVNLLNIGVNDMALLQAALKRQRAEFAGDGEVISTEDHIKVNPEIVFQEVLGLPNALLGHKTRGDDQDTPFRHSKRHDGNQP